jgi:hypothetical protein
MSTDTSCKTAETPAKPSIRRYFGKRSFYLGYLQAVLFTETYSQDGADIPLDQLISIRHVSEACLRNIWLDCRTFVRENRHLWRYGGWSDLQAGQDFWFTRAQSGVVFWSRDLVDLAGGVRRRINTGRSALQQAAGELLTKHCALYNPVCVLAYRQQAPGIRGTPGEWQLDYPAPQQNTKTPTNGQTKEN